MPFGILKPECFKCKSVDSSIWRKIKNNLDDEVKEEIICNDCSIELKKTRVYLNDRSDLKLEYDNQEENELINYDSQQLNKLFFVSQPMTRRASKDWQQSHCVPQSFYAGN